MSETKNSKAQIRLPIILALAISAGIWIGATFAEPKSNQNDLRAALYKLQEIMTYINRDYVDSVNTNELVEYGINKMLEQLDPHSSYIPARDATLAQSQLDGEFDGIGVEFGIIRDTIYVVAPLTGGPSEALGIQSGDQIIKVDGKTVAGTGVTNRDVFDLLRGPKGSKVMVDIKRKNQPELISYEITRDKIPQYSINASYMVNKEIGYVKITRFAATTYDEFKEAVADLKGQGMKKLIIDLQGNPGGYMGAAINIADEILGDRALIVSQEGKVEQYSQKAYAFRPGIFEQGSVIVLVNEGSASASEILAGAIQDNDRGLIVGRRSFGKGLVQMPIDLSDGAELRLTIARYFTPSGRSIQKPYGPDYQAYERDWMERYEHGEFFSADSIKFNDSLKYETKKGRIVYGGGGIMPDYFVPLDTTYSSAYVSRLFNSDSSREFILDYSNKNKDKFTGMSLEEYYKSFEVSDAMLQELIKVGEKNKVKYDAADFSKSKSYLKTLVKAHLGRQIYDDDAFYMVVNDINEVYLQAIKLFDEAERIALASNLRSVNEE
ncbi:MAG TPA: S41 family peptidase [Algoriphagus sp.]|uniref:Carboxyl-terminal processing protease n=1 Tax=Algoriphagus ornithinivorans TaxID=226506 RepID=A0A1I5JFY4_9BACT|nr:MULTISPECIES: S41 family peptidase [Algoriphagus]MAL15485.1 S41 family peptidase [Algoriphagus sp.]QYH41107.1 S41 family peptidase [Algoriphagus sp. NBT04N3]SFO71261.1 carboxyl-terminal processing protease [Algoriphagus ornithinivorans]HAS57895.1 S41 family peptidase [Algoriphagus sp.]HCD89707.1 S41 family peptidase [Algoriphagus sp.]